LQFEPGLAPSILGKFTSGKSPISQQHSACTEAPFRSLSRPVASELGLAFRAPCATTYIPRGPDKQASLLEAMGAENSLWQNSMTHTPSLHWGLHYNTGMCGIRAWSRFLDPVMHLLYMCSVLRAKDIHTADAPQRRRIISLFISQVRARIHASFPRTAQTCLEGKDSLRFAIIP
jgi:hypothetical protein